MVNKPEGWCFDIEGNNLYLGCTKIWYIRFKSLDGSRAMNVYPFREKMEDTRKKIIDWIYSFSDEAIVESFNGLSYDHFVLWRLLDIPFKVGKGGDWIAGKKVQFLDVFYQAQFINPNLPEFSLAALTRGSAAEKIDYRQRMFRTSP